MTGGAGNEGRDGAACQPTITTTSSTTVNARRRETWFMVSFANKPRAEVRGCCGCGADRVTPSLPLRASSVPCDGSLERKIDAGLHAARAATLVVWVDA